MRDAAGAGVGVGDSGDFRSAAGVEQMEDGKRGLAVGAGSQKTVPEGAAGYRGDFQAVGVDLAMQFVEAIDDETGQILGVDFGAASGVVLICDGRRAP